MLISIITINYNNAKGLEKTIKSVQEQSYPLIEHIVIDGGSNDDSNAIIEAYASKISYWVSEPDNGIYNAMNKGVKVANGDYCIFLNSGDKFYDFLSVQTILEERISADIVSADLILDDDVNNGYTKAPDSVDTPFLINSSLPHPSTLIRTTLMKKILYREDYKIVADWIFFFEALILRNATYQHITKPLSVFYRDGISTQKNPLILERQKYLKSVFPERVYNDIQSDYFHVFFSVCNSGGRSLKLVTIFARICLWLKRHKLLN